MAERLGSDGGIEDRNIRQGIDDPNLRDGGIDDPELRTAVDDPDLRQGIDNPDLSPAPQAMSGGIPIIPIAIVGGALVVAIAAFSLLKPGGGTGPGGAGVVAGQAKATLKITSGPPELIGEWQLDGGTGTDITGATLLATTWVGVKTGSDVQDLSTIAIGGTIAGGSRPTSKEDLSLGFGVIRDGASGEVFNYQLSSRDGTCQITMNPSGAGMTGSFTCTGITGTNASGATVTVNGEGTFSL
jgi:hypothetical protein